MLADAIPLTYKTWVNEDRDKQRIVLHGIGTGHSIVCKITSSTTVIVGVLKKAANECRSDKLKEGGWTEGASSSDPSGIAEIHQKGASCYIDAPAAATADDDDDDDDGAADDAAVTPEKIFDIDKVMWRSTVELDAPMAEDWKFDPGAHLTYYNAAAQATIDIALAKREDEEAVIARGTGPLFSSPEASQQDL